MRGIGVKLQEERDGFRDRWKGVEGTEEGRGGGREGEDFILISFLLISDLNSSHALV